MYNIVDIYIYIYVSTIYAVCIKCLVSEYDAALLLFRARASLLFNCSGGRTLHKTLHTTSPIGTVSSLLQRLNCTVRWYGPCKTPAMQRARGWQGTQPMHSCTVRTECHTSRTFSLLGYWPSFLCCARKGCRFFGINTHRRTTHKHAYTHSEDTVLFVFVCVAIDRVRARFLRSVIEPSTTTHAQSLSGRGTHVCKHTHTTGRV